MTVRVRHRYGTAPTGQSYRLGGGSKRKGAPKRPNAPVPAWKWCNPAHDHRASGGQFKDGPVSKGQATRGEQPRGHVCLPDCGCLRNFDNVFSDEYLLAKECEKARDKRAAEHEESGEVCGSCFQLISVSGNHYC